MNESWLQIITLFIANATLILWFRSESRQDWRLMDSKMESFRAEMAAIMRNTHEIIRSIQEEMKDFHARLYSLEERNKDRK